MVSVPFALDNISKLIKEQVALGGPILQAIFYFGYDKLKWYYRGYATPVYCGCSKQRQPLEGKLDSFSEGSTCRRDARICQKLFVRYLVTRSHLCLVDWDEGNYSVRDKPNIRGELAVCDDHVSLGYLNMLEATAANFFVDSTTGIRYFRTGDLGEVYDCIRIIDRKKDLEKFKKGEYLSMCKVETILKTCYYVDNICIIGDPRKTVCITLLVPTQRHLIALATSLGKGNHTLQENCPDPEIMAVILIKIHSLAQSAKFCLFEIPVPLKLCLELWTVANNLITLSFKLKRKNV